MVKIAKGLSWKPLSLKSKVLSHSLDLDGLIGVEELTDYKLDKTNNTVIIGAPKQSLKPKKDLAKSNKDSIKIIEGGIVKKKCRRKKKIKRFTVQEENKDSLYEENATVVEQEEIQSDDISAADPVSKKVAKSKKRKNKFKVVERHEDTDISVDTEDSLQTIEKSDEPLQKKLKRKQKNKFEVVERHEDADISVDPEDNLQTFEKADEPQKKQKRKQKNKSSTESTTEAEESDKQGVKKKKKKKKTYLSLNNQAVPDSSSNEDMFVEMAEWVKFNIPESIIRALYEKDFKTPTKIQSLVLPSALLARKDIVGAAETGSGKTLAFGIPILSGIVNKLENPEEEENEEAEVEDVDGDQEESNVEFPVSKSEFAKKKRNKLYALVLAPTRELAIQVQNHIIDAGKYTPVKVACVVGGMSTEKQLRILNSSPHILVATPGRLWEFIQLGHFHLTELYKINYLVIDETDRMIESGHFPELKNILDRVTMTETSQPRQTFVFSATLTHSLKALAAKKNKKQKPSKDPSIKRLQELLKIKSPKIVDITEKQGLTKTLTESKIFCKHDEKDSYLYYFILQHPGRTLVFCNSISSVKRLTLLLTMLKCSPLPLHASMNQRQRLKNLDRFRADSNAILLATDVAARGLDIPGIEHVIHYHVPRTSEIYIHRSGRTARANKEGLTVVLVEPDEIQLYIKMFNTLEKKADLPEFPTDEHFLSLVNKRLELARSIEYLESKLKKNCPDNWLEKAAHDMDIIVDDPNLIQTKESSRETALITRALTVKRRGLQTLLSKSISGQAISVTQSALQAVKLAVADDKEEKRNALKMRNKHRKKFKKRKPKNKTEQE